MSNQLEVHTDRDGIVRLGPYDPLNDFIGARKVEAKINPDGTITLDTSFARKLAYDEGHCVGYWEGLADAASFITACHKALEISGCSAKDLIARIENTDG